MLGLPFYFRYNLEISGGLGETAGKVKRYQSELCDLFVIYLLVGRDWD